MLSKGPKKRGLKRGSYGGFIQWGAQGVTGHKRPPKMGGKRGAF